MKTEYAAGIQTPRTDRPVAPFETLPTLSAETRGAVEAECFRVNDRYLDEFLEAYAFCPFSKEGRRKGQVYRHVWHYDNADLDPLADLLVEVAADPQKVVSQVIFPLIEVGPIEWQRFCHELTAWAHHRAGMRTVLALAPLHPELSYRRDSSATMVPLFRRTPDPTIQWVRVDGLAAIYEGRGKGTIFVDSSAIDEFLARPTPRPPLWNCIADTNAAMARRLGFDVIEKLLASFTHDARKSYSRVLLAADDVLV